MPITIFYSALFFVSFDWTVLVLAVHLSLRNSVFLFIFREGGRRALCGPKIVFRCPVPARHKSPVNSLASRSYGLRIVIKVGDSWNRVTWPTLRVHLRPRASSHRPPENLITPSPFSRLGRDRPSAASNKTLAVPFRVFFPFSRRFFFHFFFFFTKGASRNIRKEKFGADATRRTHRPAVALPTLDRNSPLLDLPLRFADPFFHP